MDIDTDNLAHAANFTYNYLIQDVFKVLFSYTVRTLDAGVRLTYRDLRYTIRYTIQVQEASVKVTLVVRRDYPCGNFSDHNYTIVRKYLELALLEYDLRCLF